MCLDKRVLGGLGIVGMGVVIAAPNVLATALPLLMVAICPLSMLFMGKAIVGRDQGAALAPSEMPLGATLPDACPEHRTAIVDGSDRCMPGRMDRGLISPAPRPSINASESG